jgi:hypothetical protein
MDMFELGEPDIDGPALGGTDFISPGAVKMFPDQRYAIFKREEGAVLAKPAVPVGQHIDEAAKAPRLSFPWVFIAACRHPIELSVKGIRMRTANTYRHARSDRPLADVR